MHVIAIGNQKGGVGKSALAVNLAVYAASTKRVLLVDADIQGSAALFSALREDDSDQRFDTVQMVQPILHRELPRIGQGYDLVIVDAGGRDNAAFRSALVAADSLLIPLGPSAADVWATEDVFQILDELRSGRSIVAHAAFTRVVRGTRVARDAHAHVHGLLKEQDVSLLKTIIHSRVAWPESFGEGKAVVEYDPKGEAARELRELADELGIIQ